MKPFDRKLGIVWKISPIEPKRIKSMIVILIVLQALFFGLITAFLAGQKGYDIYTFYIIGMIIGPFGLFSALLQKKKDSIVIQKELNIDLNAA